MQLPRHCYNDGLAFQTALQVKLQSVDSVTSNTLNSFQDLLDASHRQAEPQRLLFVFAKAQLPEAATEEQRQRLAEGRGGNLLPNMCVDKTPEEVADFAALVEESKSTGHDWDIVFVSSLSGRGGVAPNADEATEPLQRMVYAIHSGRVAEFAAFDREGSALRFH